MSNFIHSTIIRQNSKKLVDSVWSLGLQEVNSLNQPTKPLFPSAGSAQLGPEGPLALLVQH